DAVKRFVRQLGHRTEPPFRRMECAPGQEMQVDFGQGGWVMAEGKRRRPHLFRAVLSHSRKGYSEAVWRQTSESFLRCLENAFKDQSCERLRAQNSHLSDWEKNVADTRIHGTTRRQVGRLFEEVERSALQPLPPGLFPVFEEALRSVHRDGYVEFKKAYYSA